jgi:predicted CoA-binding protein
MSIVAEILGNYSTVAMVGLSAHPEKSSHIVAVYLKEKGYRIIPVNPDEKTVLGETSYPDLSSIPEKIDIVDIFHRSEDVPPIVREAIKIGAKAVWTQEGVINEAAAAEAGKAGLKVVMDKCMRKEHLNLLGSLCGF